MDAKWLNQQFDNHPDKNKGDLSAFLNVQASAISKMLSGNRQIKAREYMLMRKFFGQAGNGQAVEPKSRNISSYSDLAAEDSARQDWATHSAKRDYDIIEVTDASMVPDFLPGERVLIETNSSLQERPGIFALEENGHRIIRILEQSSSAKIKISCIARDIPPKIVTAKNIKILGRVTAKLNWL